MMMMFFCFCCCYFQPATVTDSRAGATSTRRCTTPPVTAVTASTAAPIATDPTANAVARTFTAERMTSASLAIATKQVHSIANIYILYTSKGTQPCLGLLEKHPLLENIENYILDFFLLSIYLFYLLMGCEAW